MKSSKVRFVPRVRTADQILEVLETRCLLSATLLNEIPTQSISATNGPASPISLSTYFNDPVIPVGDTAVDIQTNLTSSPSDIPLVLTDSATPQTVANFLQYISSGEYANTIIHRSISGFIIQGGGDHTDGSQITPFAAVPGESATATLKNTTGTIAMALTGTASAPAPNSGTDEWFINLADNPSLDDASDGGPFTAFGQVIYNGMTTVNAIAALPTYNGTSVSSEWANIPLQNYSGSLSDSNFIITNPVVVPGGLNYSASSSDPNIVSTSISNGGLILTPLGNGGTANITVTATDLGGGTASSTFTVDISAPATPPPTTVADSANTPVSTAVTINVLANDTPTSDINASSVLIDANPTSGTAAVNSDGTITYTPTTGFTGNDSFSYTVASTEGVRSSPATVSVDVGSAVTANNDSASTNHNTAVTINVLSNDTDTGAGTISPASVLVVTNPTHGTATVNSDGTITYTPTNNFVGPDTFTYTFADTDNNVSNAATVSVSVGVTIASPSKTLPASVTYTDADGTIATITLKGPGTATVNFAAAATATTAKTAVTVTGADQSVAGITTAATTTASLLTITTKGGSKIVDIGNLSTQSLRSLSAKGVIFTSDLTATGSISSLAIAGADGGTLSATSLGSFTVAQSFSDDLTLTGSGVSITNFTAASVPAGTWTLTGSAKSISTTKGDLQAAITAPSIGSIKIKGDLSSAHINLTASGTNLSTLSVTGAFTNSALTAAGNLGAISATSLSDSEIFAGIGTLGSSQAFPASSTDFAAQSSIKSISLKTVKGADSFSNSGVAAANLINLSLGTLQTDNSSNPTGIAAESITTLTATATKKFTLHKLNSTTDLTALLAKAGAVITPDFQIDLIAS